MMLGDMNLAGVVVVVSLVLSIWRKKFAGAKLDSKGS